MPFMRKAFYNENLYFNDEELLLLLSSEHFEEQNHHHVQVCYNHMAICVREGFHLPSFREYV